MNVAGLYSLIQLEEVGFGDPNSSRLFNRIAAVVNKALTIASVSAVGEMEFSLLTEAQFQSQKGAGWVLMDGRNVAGSQYASLFSVSNIPDFRGLYVRGKDNGAGQDPFGELATGFVINASSYQTHSHAGTITIEQNPPPVAAFVFTAYKSTYNNGGNASGRYHGSAYFEVPPTPAQFATVAAGGNESRARNITVNYFIKID